MIDHARQAQHRAEFDWIGWPIGRAAKRKAMLEKVARASRRNRVGICQACIAGRWRETNSVRKLLRWNMSPDIAFHMIHLHDIPGQMPVSRKEFIKERR